MGEPAGPFARRLNSYGNIIALVCGRFGEWSPDMSSLLGALADTGARKHWRLMGARSHAIARGLILDRLRRSIGIHGLLSMARLRLEKLNRALGTSSTFDQSRKAAKAQYRAWRYKYFDRHTPPPRFGGRNWRSRAFA